MSGLKEASAEKSSPRTPDLAPQGYYEKTV